MNIQIDNYYISVSNRGCMNIYIEGQMIVQAYTKYMKREELINIAVRLINDYNKRHNLEWGCVDR